MKLLQVYNQYRSLFNGEEAVVAKTASLLEARGWSARLWMRSSRGLDQSLGGRMHAFHHGIYSRRSYREMRQWLQNEQPDIVHAHNLYPLFSPSVLVACREAGVPVVMTLHNHMLTCPRSDHLRRGRICEQCTGGREYRCVVNNCRENLFESVAYALRSAFARRARLFQDNVHVFIALTKFAKQRLVDQGFDAEQVSVLPNLFISPHPPVPAEKGEYIAYVGRMSAEKGVQTLIKAAALYPPCRVHLAGDGPLREALQAEAGQNTEFLGHVKRDAMADFYRKSRFLVVPSHCFEMSPLVIAEAMCHGVPVLASRIGGLAELVDDGVTGLLFEPFSARDLAKKIETLWNSPELCRRLGRAAHQQAQRCDENSYYRGLMKIYEKAMIRAGRQPIAWEQQTELASVY